MAITVTCHCGKKLNARDEHAGMRAKCPACGAVLLVPKPAASPAQSRPTPVPAGAASAGLASAAGAASAVKPGGNATAATGTRPALQERPRYDGKPLADWLELLRSNDPAERRNAAAALAKVGAEAKIELPALIERLKADHVLVRHWAISCLKQMGPAAAGGVEPLLGRLTDEQEPLLRDEAARALVVVVPGGDRFLPRLLKGLSEKKAEARQSAIDCFRRDLRTAGVSRRRFWMCSCGSVFEKEDLERQLRELAASGSPPAWQGIRKCKKCGKEYPAAAVYAGKHDVPDKYRAKLAARYGDRVDLPDDLLADAPKEDLGYQIREGPSIADTLETPSPHAPLTIPLADAGEGYAIAAATAAGHGPSKLKEAEPEEENEEEATILAPGEKVRTTGKYRCTSCGKGRLSAKGAGTGQSKAAEPKQVVVKTFKAGKKFGECPNCGDLTEWELVVE